MGFAWSPASRLVTAFSRSIDLSFVFVEPMDELYSDHKPRKTTAQTTDSCENRNNEAELSRIASVSARFQRLVRWVRAVLAWLVSPPAPMANRPRPVSCWTMAAFTGGSTFAPLSTS